MSSSRGAAELRVSNEELIRRAKSRHETFARLWEGELADFSSPEEALFAGCTLLAWEQRGYRDRDQVARVLRRLPLVNEVTPEEFDTNVDRAIRTVDEIFNRESTTDLDELIAKLGALSPDERRRAARKRGFKWPSTSEVQTQLENAVFETMAQRQNRVFVAPTALGKTDLVVTTKWLDRQDITGGEPVVLFVGTKEARDEAKERAEEAGLNVTVLESYDDICPVARGEYDDIVEIGGMPASFWFEEEIKSRGINAGTAHERAKEIHDGELPCCPGEERCELREQWDHVPRHDDYDAPIYDLIIATNKFAHVPPLRQSTNIILDEQPSYTKSFENNDQLNQQRIQEMVGAYLKEVEAPVTTWEAFVTLARDIQDRQFTTELENALQRMPEKEWYHTGDGAHTLAPMLTRAIWEALTTEPDQNGRSTATIEYDPDRTSNDIDDDEHEPDELKRLSVVIDEENTIQLIRSIPDFSRCRSVIGLDAWPCPPLWERNVLPKIDIERILDNEERRLWRLFERGLMVVQVGEATRSVTRGENFNERHARVIIEALHAHYPDRFASVGTPMSIEDRIEAMMYDVGIDDLEKMHHGEQKSRNEFRDKAVGLLYGCIDPGDHNLANQSAECGYTARPEYRSS